MTVLEMKDRSSVLAHINMLQGIINRMASNSANCKLWCVTLLTAILALFFDGKVLHLKFCYLITSLFYFLDCFYLGIEQQIINEQKDFVNMLNECKEQQVAKQIFNPYTTVWNNSSPYKRCCLTMMLSHFVNQLWNTIKAIGSFSTTPFYGAIFCAIYYF